MSDEKSTITEIIVCKNCKGGQLLRDLYVRLYFQDAKTERKLSLQDVNRSDLFLVRCLKSLIKIRSYRDNLMVMQIGGDYSGRWSVQTHRYSFGIDQEEMFEEVLIDGLPATPTHTVSVFKTKRIDSKLDLPTLSKFILPPEYEDDDL